MKQTKKSIVGIGAAIMMLLLIIDAQIAFQGASEGIELCLKTVIPSLFPFFFLSVWITSSLSDDSGKLLRPFGKICGIPKGAESILFLGLLGGYPIGAQSVAAAYQAGSISKKDGQRMLGFCNQAGPAFLFGIVGSSFHTPWLSFGIWIILIISAILTGIILPGKSNSVCTLIPQKATKPLETALKAMASVCGWVVLFRVLLHFLKKWFLWIFPYNIQFWVTGLLELTNGCILSGNIVPLSFRIVSLTGMLAFGGLCVGMQTISVADKLDCKLYILGKFLQTLIAILLSVLMCIVAKL